MITALANPHRFMGFSRWAAPLLGAVALLFVAPGLWLGLAAAAALFAVAIYLRRRRELV